jgi:diadenosine tetraphosphatase ApaH/serine/threonine PP2A family protein phosphatase
MRVAVISDIHANLHALEAVFAALDAERTDAVWSLGDTVGYGPRPNRCCLSLAARAGLALCGNHDLGVLGAIDLEEFSGEAADAALWTRKVLSTEARSYLEGLAPSGSAEGVELFHGSPRDPVWDYVLSGEAALDAFELTTAPLVLVGHSHLPIQIVLAGQALTGGLAPHGTEVDLSEGRWLLNPGSVGQPRDGDPRAAFLLVDLAAGRASFRRVEYDVGRTQAEIRERGLPDALAERLARGV